MNDVVPWVLDVILNKHIISPNPHVRQAACIWLLSLVRKLSTHKEVKVSRAINVISSTGNFLRNIHNCKVVGRKGYKGRAITNGYFKISCA